ncbi:P-loop containing nucleoside triphosphate hydrolase protein [Cucurbitaria berberidis CBS 394.84]|uniref:P-loop containing nucleoside triphosphate hydrolase protein n=1 Tax=Cucurbitaria berberidis CBS 394.84 TaxID=1168544 RepID=A0A9P4L7Y8_9PLEO|nr:P-loop containing nucleoside triphosphate hydrolase protein [Cucurbitaria berberidis CBS 394.84]KAF1845480.1 P-loop containing nucleoside triphosphate hydrolase protein [Cucurbitaria berberidis CBS 394.84]
MATKGNMHGEGNVKIARQDLSKLVAVPKLPPRSKPAPVAPSNSSPQTGTASSDSTFPRRETISTTAKSPRYGDDETSKTTRELVKWEYDVYATPFIPSALRSINTEEAVVITTKPKYWIDSQAYAHTFIGTSFIPDRPLNALETKYKQVTLPEERFIKDSYFQYFNRLMNIESAAKTQEHETHALYKVPLHRISTPDGQIWALSVPGLREDSPVVEMGDTLQIRQLWMDSAGNPMPVPMYMESHGMGHPSHAPVFYKTWTGVQHNGSVYSINRAQETVYLKVEGLDFLHLGSNVVPLEANVSFPLRYGLLGVQRGALARVNLELRQTVCLFHQNNLTNLDDGRIDFDGVPEVEYASTGTPEKCTCALHNDWVRRMLFPRERDGQLQTRLRKIPHRALFDPAVNYEQAHAVNDICASDYGTLPYLISGPPGTGKTKTLVETAMQLLNTTKTAHMIICAPSEAAADTLALRLKHYLNNKQLFRLNRPGRADNEVPRELMQYCYIENDMFYLPPFKTLMAFNVVVTSSRDVAILAEVRVTNNDLWTLERNMFSALHPEDQAPTPSLHWGALLIDEAAQATEIDVLPAISVVCPPSAYPTHLPQTRLVLAGDDNQLGPRTASRDPEFSTSLFARLSGRTLYKDHPLSRSNLKPSSGPPVIKRSMLPIIYPPFTLLVRNYRSHPAILSVPSSLFYNDTLMPEAPTPSTPLQQSSLWRGRKWPVLFIPHIGPDEIERDGGGWYNIREARLACSIAQTLVEESRVQQKDICIMSPFAAQVKLLRFLIRSETYGGGAGLWEVNIGPLEAFQGLENRVVIICTTRTRERFLDMDEKRGLGIIGQKRKMNVALTRAKEALFVIGSPVVLGQDEHWRQWLAFCWRNGLVADKKAVWKGDEEGFGKEKIGVLERALIVKENHGSKYERALGAGAASHDINGNSDYEAWIESLREALDEEDQDDEDGEGSEEYENEDEDEIENSDGEEDSQGESSTEKLLP